MAILVTGASGFVGSALVRQLATKDRKVIAAGRDIETHQANVTSFSHGQLNGHTDWAPVLEDCSEIVHTAAMTTATDVSGDDAEALYQSVNVDAVVRLAEQAAQASVKRLVFLSSVKVYSQQQANKGPLTIDIEPNPSDLYGRSKFAAENSLQKIAQESDLEITIIRPPLIYAPGVKGNFRSLIKISASRIPLPLGAINNRRSLVALENLLSLIDVCLEDERAVGATFLVSDQTHYSTSDLIRLMADGMGKKAKLWPCPIKLIRYVGQLLNRPNVVDSLLGSLEVDSKATQEHLNWTPPIDAEEGIRATAAAYLNTK